MDIMQKIDALPWLPHPTARGMKIKPLVSRKDTGLNVTCMLVQVPAWIEAPEHGFEGFGTFNCKYKMGMQRAQLMARHLLIK